MDRSNRSLSVAVPDTPIDVTIHKLSNLHLPFSINWLSLSETNCHLPKPCPAQYSLQSIHWLCLSASIFFFFHSVCRSALTLRVATLNATNENNISREKNDGKTEAPANHSFPLKLLTPALFTPRPLVPECVSDVDECFYIFLGIFVFSLLLYSLSHSLFLSVFLPFWNQRKKV